ncbi:MAG: hypothetical protein U0903_17070 [Planctomycetales bacterium]
MFAAVETTGTTVDVTVPELVESTDLLPVNTPVPHLSEPSRPRKIQPAKAV